MHIIYLAKGLRIVSSSLTEVPRRGNTDLHIAWHCSTSYWASYTGKRKDVPALPSRIKRRSGWCRRNREYRLFFRKLSFRS
jgi:hypothetical protein